MKITNEKLKRLGIKNTDIFIYFLYGLMTAVIVRGWLIAEGVITVDVMEQHEITGLLIMTVGVSLMTLIGWMDKVTVSARLSKRVRELEEEIHGMDQKKEKTE